MLTNDSELNELMNESIRPKCTPFIEVDKVVGANGESFYRAWDENTVSNISYKRGVDPLGRTLPYMELVWSEPYSEEFLEGSKSMSRPEVFGTLDKVTFILAQYTSFDGDKRKDINFPVLWLVGAPVINGSEVVWTARDMLYFLNRPQEIGFQKGTVFKNILRYFLLDERASFKNNIYDDYFISLLQNTQLELKYNTEGAIEGAINAPVVYSDKTKNLLKDIASTRNYFWTFGVRSMELKSFGDLLSPKDPVYVFRGSVMKKFPDLTQNSNVSSFNFSIYTTKFNENEKYTLTTPTSVVSSSGVSVNKYELVDWGTISEVKGHSLKPTIISKTMYLPTTTTSVTIIPVDISNEEFFVNNGKTGEQYIENNKCLYSDSNYDLTNRIEPINKYFNNGVYTMQFECLPHFAIKPCDFVGVEVGVATNGESILKYGVVVEQELSYNGAWSQKNTVHEVSRIGTV